MARRGRSLRDMRAEYEAAEARGLLPKDPPKDSKTPASPARPLPKSQPGLKIVWAVCDQAGHVTATFPYNEKDRAQEHADALKAKGKGKFFLRADKVRIDA